MQDELSRGDNRIEPNTEEIIDLLDSLSTVVQQMREADGHFDVAAFLRDNKASMDAISERRQGSETRWLLESAKCKLQTAMVLATVYQELDSGNYPVGNLQNFRNTIQLIEPELRQFARQCLRAPVPISQLNRKLFPMPTDATLSQVGVFFTEPDITIPPAK